MGCKISMKIVWRIRIRENKYVSRQVINIILHVTWALVYMSRLPYSSHTFCYLRLLDNNTGIYSAVEVQGVSDYALQYLPASEKGRKYYHYSNKCAIKFEQELLLRGTYFLPANQNALSFPLWLYSSKQCFCREQKRIPLVWSSGIFLSTCSIVTTGTKARNKSGNKTFVSSLKMDEDLLSNLNFVFQCLMCFLSGFSFCLVWQVWRNERMM